MLKTFKLVALLEGISYLLLFGVTMPLKYMLDMGLPNRILGMAHGFLFLFYIVLAILIKEKEILKWAYKTLGNVLFCSISPFGTFWMDKKYLRDAV